MKSSFRRPLEIYRLGKAELMENGLFSEPSQTRFTIEASVQQLRPD